MVDTNGKKKKKGNVDRINLLPDSLIHHILSFLPIHQVVQTCVLSKRWKTVWTHIPTINFDFTSYHSQFDMSKRNYPSIDTSFKRIVNGVLSQLCGTHLQKLSYSTPRAENYKDKYLVEFLICYAGRHMLRELYIDAPCMDYFDWQFCLLDCKSLTVMKMSCGFVEEWGSLMLPSLRTLEINGSWDEQNQYLELEFKGKMFSGCPNLESLVLDDFLFESFGICAPKLEYLEFGSSYKKLHFLDLELSTPKLKCVKFRNVLAAVDSNSDFPRLDIVSFVIEDFKVDLFDKPTLVGYILKFLRAFHNAKSLTLPLDALKALASTKSLCFSTESLRFQNLRHLKLKTELETNNMIDLPIISLMPCFPVLNTFVIDVNKE